MNSPALAIQTFGRFQVFLGAAPIPNDAWGTHRARTLFKLLLTHYGESVTSEQIMEAIWPDATPKSAARDLYKAVSDLRRVLEPDLPRRGASTFILSTESGYQFNPDCAHSLDTLQFERLVAQAQEQAGAQQWEPAAHSYTQAIVLYAGDYLPDDVYAEWSLATRERLRTTFITALLNAAEVQARLGRYRQAIALCRRVLELDDCLETAYRSLMLYQYAAGDRAQALRVYAECAAALERALGVEPLPATEGLAAEIRAGAVALVDSGRTQQERQYPRPATVALPYALSQMPLVGRQRELGQLRAAWEEARVGRGGLLVVSGEAGVGKSYLLDHAVRSFGLADDGLLRAAAHQLTRDLPYHLVIELMRQAWQRGLFPLEAAPWMAVLVQVLPEIGADYPGLEPAPAEDKPGLFDAMRRCWLALVEPPPGRPATPLVMLLEDLHWADASTLEFLAYVVPQLAESPILLLGSARPAEQVAPLLQPGGRAAGWGHIALNPLAEDEVVELLERLGGVEGRRLGQRLKLITGGNPLFVAGIVAALFERGQLWVDQAGRWQGVSSLLAAPILPIPDAVQALVQQRTHQLTATARRVLNVATVLEEGFDFDLLEALFRDTPAIEPLGEAALLDALDELLGADLLGVDPGQSSFHFRHAAFREAVYARLSPPRRQRIHQAVGALLESRSPGAIGRLAHHFGRSNDTERAVRYLLAAGQQAVEVYANSTALGYFEQVLAAIRAAEAAGGSDEQWLAARFQAESSRARMAYYLGLPDIMSAAAVELRRLADRLEGIEQMDALIYTAYMLSAVENHADVVAITDVLLPRLDGPEYGRQREGTWRVRGYAMWSQGLASEMAECFDHAVAAARNNQNNFQLVHGLSYQALAYTFLTRWDDAWAALREAAELADAAADPSLQALVGEGWINLWEPLGRWDEAAAAIDRCAELYQRLEREDSLLEVLHNRGWLAVSRGDDAAARQCLQQSLDLARTQDKPATAGTSLLGLAMIAARQRDYAASRPLFEQAIAQFERLDNRMNLTSACSQAALALLDQGDPAAAAAALARAGQPPFTKYTSLYQLAQARVRAAAGDPAAADLLGQAQASIRAQAAALSDPATRASFLRHPHSRLILDTTI
jgi:DNA-binding SARP family transcriptional activator